MSIAVFYRKGEGRPRRRFKGKGNRNLSLQILHGGGTLFPFHHKVHRAALLRPFAEADGETAALFLSYILHRHKGHGVMVRFIGDAHGAGKVSPAMETEGPSLQGFHISRIHAVIARREGCHHVPADMVVQIGRGIAPVKLLLQGLHQRRRIRFPPLLCRINGPAIGGHGVVHILHALHAPLYLQGRYTGGKEIGNPLNAKHILQT